VTITALATGGTTAEERIRRNWGLFFALVVLFAPTLFTRTSIVAPPGVAGKHGAKAIEAVAIALLGLWMIRERHLPRIGLPMCLALLWLGQAYISGVWAINRQDYAQNIERFMHGAASGVVLTIAIRDRRDLETAMLWWKILSFCVGALILVEVMFPWIRAGTDGEGSKQVMGFEEDIGSYYRALGPQGHSNWFGYFFGITLLLTPYMWVRYTTPAARALIVASTIVEFLGLVFGYVRLGMMGMAAGFLWFILRGGMGNPIKPILSIVVLVAVAYPVLPHAWKERVTDPDHWQQSDSIGHRMSQQIESLRLLNEYAGWGIGYGTYGTLYVEQGKDSFLAHIMRALEWETGEVNSTSIGGHNTYMEVFLEQGWVGIILYLGVGLSMLFCLWRWTPRNKGDPPAWTMGMVLESMVVSAALMNGVLHTQDRRVGWTFYALGSAYIVLTRSGLIQGRIAPQKKLHVPAAAIQIGAPLVVGLGFLVAAAAAIYLFFRAS